MSTIDAYTRRFINAVERRSKEQFVQRVQKVNTHITESSADITNVDTTDTATVTPSASSVMQSDEEYRTTIITKMLNLIAKQKGKTK